MQQATLFNERRDLNKIGKPVDKKEWGMTPPTVNAYYNPAMNDINFPAGILQPPFYDFKIDPAVNFGGIGVVIGHEMTHGFDDQGSQYDPQGNVRNWWTPEDSKKFDERTDCDGEGVQRLRGRAWTEPERQANAGREHSRQRRSSHRLRGADVAQRATAGTGLTSTQVDGLHSGATLLYRLRPGMVREFPRGGCALLAKTDPHQPGGGASTAACRTSTTSAKPLAARSANR